MGILEIKNTTAKISAAKYVFPTIFTLKNIPINIMTAIGINKQINKFDNFVLLIGIISSL